MAVARIEHMFGARLRKGARVLDPFAGIGGIHALSPIHYRTTGVELEQEWAEQHPLNEVGNALHLRWRRGTFNAIATSPCYGNRIADHHDARDDSKRHTYKHYLGRDLSPESAAALQWGDEYRVFHTQAIMEATRVCKKDAWWALNMSDHFRAGHIQPVTSWWITALTALGWEWVDAFPIHTRRLRHGAHSRLRAQVEWVLLLQRVA